VGFKAMAVGSWERSASRLGFSLFFDDISSYSDDPELSIWEQFSKSIIHCKFQKPACTTASKQERCFEPLKVL
jgi:hypothetical protein